MTNHQMTGADILQMQFDRLAQEFKNTLVNLGAQRLAWRPSPRMNDIGSLLWHSARAWDGYLFYLDGADELFVSQDWARRFHMQGRLNESWIEVFTEDQVAHVRERPKLFLEYVGAIHARTKDFLSTVTPEQVATLVKIPWWPDEKPKAFVLAHVIRHSYEHLGEAQYLKGLMKAKSSPTKAKNANRKAKSKKSKR